MRETEIIQVGSIINIKHCRTGTFLKALKIPASVTKTQQMVVATTDQGPGCDWEMTSIRDSLETKSRHMVVHLTHCDTRKKLHSHSIRAAYSPSDYEVTSYGPDTDPNDNWLIEFEGDGEWELNQKFRIRHVATQAHLNVPGPKVVDPALGIGELEVTSSDGNSEDFHWIALPALPRTEDRIRIRSIHLKHFKRFTDLTIAGLTPEHRLVVLVGPNGCGKSSIFESFNSCIAAMESGVWYDRTYHFKAPTGEDNDVLDVDRLNRERQQWDENLRPIQIEFWGAATPHWQKPEESERKYLYIRGSTRTSADHTSDSIQRLRDLQNEKPSPEILVALDSRVNHNYQRLVNFSAQEYNNPGDRSDAEVAKAANRLLRELQKAVKRVFADLELLGLGNPTSQGTFIFKKETPGKWRFRNLSSGEKSVFDLLLDFIIQKESRTKTVFCIDEPELHIHPELQSRLLREFLEHMPPGWQLWIATHSIGMMREAKLWGEQHPEQVAFLSLANRNFDARVVISPEQCNRQFWRKTFQVAIGDLVELVAPKQIVFCEGGRRSGVHDGGEFDARCFRRIFANEFPDTEFLSQGGAAEVEKRSDVLISFLNKVTPGVQTISVIDRDDRSNEQVERCRKDGIRVLDRRHLESFLYDDEILTKLCQKYQPQATQQVLKAKKDAMTESGTRNPPDDVKSARGKIYNAVKGLLGLTQKGNDSEEFCISELAPLITPDTQTYKQLQLNIFGK